MMTSTIWTNKIEEKENKDLELPIVPIFITYEKDLNIKKKSYIFLGNILLIYWMICIINWIPHLFWRVRKKISHLWILEFQLLK